MSEVIAFGGRAPIRWQPVSVHEVIVAGRLRQVSQQHVARVKASFERLNGQLQLQPIVLDQDLVLIDGAHRLEAAKQAGWNSISAVIVEAAADERALLETEANLVRRELSPAELEEVWRTHYEPRVKQQTHAKRAASLRRGADTLVIGNTDNGQSISIAKAAKTITGLSLDTLRKVSEIRDTSKSELVPDEVRAAADHALHKLRAPQANVTAAHRKMKQAMFAQAARKQTPEELRGREVDSRLYRLVDDVTALAEALETGLGPALEEAAVRSQSNLQLLRSARVALAQSLATVVAAECRLEDQPLVALKGIGSEVGRFLSRVSRAKIADPEAAVRS